MPQKILVAEQIDSIRTVTESVLRQKGYDVIAVTAAEKAREVLEYSRPDLIIVGTSLMAPEGAPYYEILRSEESTASIPTLLFQPTDNTKLDVAPDSIIGLPIDPQHLVASVTRRLGQSTGQAEKSQPSSPLDLDDDILDAALGLDGIEVTDSEVMDKTAISQRRKRTVGDEKMIGLDSDHGHRSLNDSDQNVPAVESLMLDEGSDKARHRTIDRKPMPADGTGKLDILPDQFGMSRAADPGSDEDSAHDYDWFVNSMQTDHSGRPKPADQAQPDDGKLHFTNTSATVDPTTPNPQSPPGRRESGTVDEFIDEFKREMEEIRAGDDDQEIIEPKLVSEAAEQARLPWDDKLEQIGPAQIDLFTREFAHRLGEKVAEIIAAKIDPDKLLRMIRDELVVRQKKS